MTQFTIGGGCFWCIDAVMRRLKSVSNVVSGYAGGTIKNPSYEQVSDGTTGHAETVQITFDETIIPAATLLDIFFLVHDPTTPNRQGNDIGTQYRSIMLYENDEQKQQFEAAIKRASSRWTDKIVTEIVPLETFYPAEDYHQDYFNKNPDAGYCQIIIAPKVIKARHEYKEWFNET